MPHTLVILPNNLGDVIMAVPVLEGLRVRFPGCRIGFLVEDGFEGGVENCSFCDEVIRFPRKGIRGQLISERWEVGIDSLQRIVKEIDRSGYKMVLNLCQHEYISYLVSLIDAAEIRGRRFVREGNQAIADPWSQYLYAIPFARRFNSLHATDVYRRVGEVTAHGGKYGVALTEEESKRARALLRSKLAKYGSGRLAVFQPGAAYAAKRWPAESYVSLGRMLVEDGWHIVVTGVRAESGPAREIAEALGDRCATIAGETTFREAMGVVGQAQACVTGDTALMHASAGLGVRTYALFGPTNPVETGPYGDGHWVFSAPCSDRPCFRLSCPSMQCMDTIPAKTVFACMTQDDPGPDPGCDIFRTALKPNGDYELVLVSGDPDSYTDRSGAAMTRIAMGDEPLGSEVKESHRRESRHFSGTVARMAGALDSYLSSGNTSHITEYGALREQVQQQGGVAGFWAALLNIRLNSVPLLDPVDGVKRSRDECRRTIDEVARIVAYRARKPESPAADR